ncbi:MAG: porin [Myxococcota bacterium]
MGLAMICAVAAAAAPKVGPVVIDGGHGHVLRLRLISQWLVEGTHPTNEGGVTPRARLRRLRLVPSGDLADGAFRYSVQLSFAPRSNELLDLWLEPRIGGPWRLRIGQYKTPFTRYRIGSFADLQLVGWSVVTQYFGNERQIGAMLHHGYRGGQPVELQIGVFTGQNARRSHGLAAPVLYGQPRPNPSDLSDPSARFAELHPELVIHAGWSSREFRVSRWDDTDGGSARLHLGASASHDLRPTYGQDATTRVAGEALLKVRRLSVGAVGYAATFPTRRETTVWGLLGGLAEASVRVAERHTVAVRIARIDVLRFLQNDVAAVRRDDGRLDVADPDLPIVDREEELTVGWKGDLWGDTVQLTIDLHTRHTRTSDAEVGSVGLRGQLQTRL